MNMDSSRALHSYGVARKMKEMAEERKPGDSHFAEDMFLLGLLHDVGYEFTTFNESHGQIGGYVLRGNGYAYWREVYHHGNPESECVSTALEMLNRADLCVDEEGVDVGVERRLEGIAARHGKQSEPYLNAAALALRLGMIG